jgi:hypothetical protein
MVSLAPRQLYPRERTPGTYWIGGRVGPRGGLDTVAKIKVSTPCRESNPDRPACSLVTILTELSRLHVIIMGVWEKHPVCYASEQWM